ncbi:MAG TPA: hypothetical protein VHT70_03645 [Candidatus Saccharimonadales bacterium]|nr:hypothetical protein [Candidatus Saccharimonadales bacterium]
MIERGYGYHPPEGQPHPYDNPRMPFRDQVPYPRLLGAVNPADYQNRAEYEARLAQLNADHAYQQFTAGQQNYGTPFTLSLQYQEIKRPPEITTIGQDLRAKTKYVEGQICQNPDNTAWKLPATLEAEQEGAYVTSLPHGDSTSYFDVRYNDKTLPAELSDRWQGSHLIAKTITVEYNMQRECVEIVYRDLLSDIDGQQPADSALSVGVKAAYGGYATWHATKLYTDEIFDPAACHEQIISFQAAPPLQSLEVPKDW